MRFSRAALVLGLPCSRLYAAFEAYQSCLLYSHGGGTSIVSPISRLSANRAPGPVSRSRPNRETGVFRSPIPAESGIGAPFPVSRPNRESGERESGISGTTGDTQPWQAGQQPALLIHQRISASCRAAAARPMIEVSLAGYLLPAQSLPCQRGPHVFRFDEVLPTRGT